MHRLVQVRLREAGKISFYDAQGMRIKVGNYCIVEAERGLEYGQVLTAPELVADDKIEGGLKKVSRVATRDDLAQIQKNKSRIEEVIKICSSKIQERKLTMKLISAEYSFDRSKLIFYFTAEGRVDFRDLVKDLASHFKARIELKQIGVRDEAKLLGGFGPCGKSLCCAKFLKDFEPVTIRMAKDQKLSLNPAKISGLCGRLMCCLSYEACQYRDLIKGLPKEGQTIKTKQGSGKVLEVNILKRSCLVDIGEGRQIEVKY